jgi:porphyrinogen peroxidase
MMGVVQPGILAPLPLYSRYIELDGLPDCDLVSVLRGLSGFPITDGLVIGLGSGLLSKLGQSVDGTRAFPSLSGLGCEIPSSQSDLFCWVRGDDRGQIIRTTHALTHMLSPAFSIARMVDGFKYDRGLDLTGYEDGTENPEGDAAYEAAIVQDAQVGLKGSSFVAIQQWVHDIAHFETMGETERDHIMGRRKSDNEELEDAPASAHVKRTAQESFDPEAFIVRRSMPWADTNGEGLMFTAFGKSFDAFEAQLRRMIGQDDGIVDGLFRFTHPISGSYFWCPPLNDKHMLDLSVIGLE